MSKDEKTAVVYKGYEELEPYDLSAPEKELLRAILVTALNDLKKKGHDKRQATEFFLSPEDDYIFSFISICDYLRVSPNKVLMVAGLKQAPAGVCLGKIRAGIFDDQELD